MVVVVVVRLWPQEVSLTIQPISINTNGGNKLRHMTEVHDNYVKECVKYERGDTKWVVTTEQLADILTKLNFKIHKELTDKILNYE